MGAVFFLFLSASPVAKVFSSIFNDRVKIGESTLLGIPSPSCEELG